MKEEFVNILITKGPEAFNCFLSALSKTNQSHIKDYLLKSRDVNEIDGVTGMHISIDALLSRSDYLFHEIRILIMVNN